LWENPDLAQRVMKRLSWLRADVENWRGLERRIADALELTQLGDDSLRGELEPETNFLETEIEKRELQAMLSGKHDHGNALLAIHAGAGGTDSQDWAQCSNMYRW
jgi:peptide chain release factor 2